MINPNRSKPLDYSLRAAASKQLAQQQRPRHQHQTNKQPADQWRVYSQTISSASAKQHLKSSTMASAKKQANLADLQHTYATPIAHLPLPPLPVQQAPAYVYAEPPLSRSQTMVGQQKQRQKHQQQPQPQPQPQYQAVYESSQFPLVASSSLHTDQALTLSRPLCRCRVMYLGSSVPHITKNGLHGIQEPLKHLYPEEQFNGARLGKGSRLAGVEQVTTIDISHLSSTLGIDSWLSVWSNGLLLQNVDEFGQEIKRFFSIESLHYCAAVRYFDTGSLKSAPAREAHSNDLLIAEKESQHSPKSATTTTTTNNNNNQDQNNNISSDHHQSLESSAPKLGDKVQQAPANTTGRSRGMARFLPLDAPLFQVPGMMDASHPPVFAAIMRRTTGIKVLECHAFICRRDAAANALVRCCTHAYADLLSAKRLSIELAAAAVRRQSWSPSNLAPQPSEPARAATLGRHLLRKQQQQRPAELADFARRKSASSLSRTGSSLDEDEDGQQSRSSEDNYAIISHHSRPAQMLATSQRRERKTSKGSSKSLFSDFQPNIQSSCSSGTQGAAFKADKMSHSMELINRLELDREPIQPQSGHNQQVDYSVVSSRRHSKSMQNLARSGAKAEFCASSARCSSRLSRSRKRAERQLEASKSGRARIGESQERRAASMHDMSSPACQQTMKGQVAEDKQELLYDGVPASYRRGDVTPTAAHARPIETHSRANSRSRKQSRRSKSGDHRSSSRHRRRAHESGGSQVYEVPKSAASHPLAMEPALVYSGGQAALAYASPPQTGPFCLAPAPLMPPYLAAFGPDGMALPMTAYGLAYPLHPAVYQQQQQQMAAMFAAASSAAGGATLTARGRHKGRALARFRCLSPPINLVVAGKPQRNSTAPSEVSASGSTAPQDPTAPAVVSGQPSFLAGGRAKRLSWIKRLSLTLSSGSGSLARDSMDMSHNPDATSQRPKEKRSSLLFGGSLTLGRSRRQQANVGSAQEHIGNSSSPSNNQ